MDVNNLKLKLGEANSDFSRNVQEELLRLDFTIPEAAEYSADIIAKKTYEVLDEFTAAICEYLSKL